ncbi:hypothetical protein EFL44_07835 [Lactococcus cremoris]|uniref:hypothetical protein n=1 Tax=Lactococcus lactis subsp. cremoris TaxID=1359 RepID=UPI0021821F97|nr:hypothetical protein [Lactococcus cremoris]MCT0467031.1 hypothetical protein [Lactococcus cremoris]
MKSITSKQTAFVGNILTTVMVAFMGTINIINNLYSFAGYSPFVIALMGIVAMSVYPVLEWVAYSRIGKRGGKWWKLFLLVMGILSIFHSYSSLGNILVFSFRIIIGICYIFTFFLKDTKLSSNSN